MAMYFVQPIKDELGNKNAWGVYKKHGSGTRLLSDHKDFEPAFRRAKRVANKGDKIGIKRMNDSKNGAAGTFRRWHTVR